MLENFVFAYRVYLFVTRGVLITFEKLQKRILASSCLSFRPYVHSAFRMEQLCSHRTDFREI